MFCKELDISKLKRTCLNLERVLNEKYMQTWECCNVTEGWHATCTPLISEYYALDSAVITLNLTAYIGGCWFYDDVSFVLNRVTEKKQQQLIEEIIEETRHELAAFDKQALYNEWSSQFEEEDLWLCKDRADGVETVLQDLVADLEMTYEDAYHKQLDEKQ